MQAHEQAENQIIRAALESLVAAGHRVAVWNGEDWSAGPSRDVEMLLGSLRATDVDVLHLMHDQEREPSGSWVLLVYGNEPFEVMADWTLDLDELLKPAVELAERIEAAEER